MTVEIVPEGRPLEDLTQEEIVEASRLSKEFFLRTFYTIPSVERGRAGLSTFKLREYQADILDSIELNDRIIGLKARQIGWTTVAVANALHDALFHEWRPWLFISRGEGPAQDMLSKAMMAYDRLPAWMRRMLPKVEQRSASRFGFDNGSRIDAVPATPSTGRGDAVYGTLMDECAFMEYAEDIWAAVEPLTYGPAMLFSTANGMGNFFHDIWLDSQRPDSAWKGIFFPWDVVPTRDLAWYEGKRLEHRIKPWFFFQEYPSTPEEAFAKSGRVAFAADAVEEVYEAIEPAKLFEWNISEGAVERDITDYGKLDIEIRMWKEPLIREYDDGQLMAKPNYVVGVDVAEGLEHGDYSYINVFDTYNNEQVLSCRTHIPVFYLVDMIEWVAKEYFNGLVTIERNMAGIMPIEILANQRYYPRMYRMDRFAEMMTEADRTPRFGWVTDKKSKAKMVLDFQRALASGNMILHDPDFVLEAQTFVADGKGSYGATAGNHDDTIMGTLITWQGVLDSPSYPITWVDKAVRPLTFDDIDEYLYNQKAKPDNPLDSYLGQGPRKDIKRGLFIAPSS